MKAANFIYQTTEALKKFLAKEFESNSDLPRVEFRSVIPPADELSSQKPSTKSGFLSIFHLEEKPVVYLTAYQVQRGQPHRSPIRIAEEKMIDGSRLSFS